MSGLTLFPAIDLMGGEVVRLTRGEAESRVAYSADPVEQARRFAADGATHLHVVDLDAAFRRGDNRAAIERIVRGVDLRVQVGGGIRELTEITRLSELGVARVVIGSAAVERPDLVAAAIETFGAAHVAVGLDAESGQLKIKGWTEQSGQSAAEVALRMAGLGVRSIVYTDISRDGMLAGADLDGAVDLARHSGCRVVVSGGVADLEHLGRIAAHPERERIEGVIVGKALYEGRFGVPEALRALGEAEPC